VDTGSGNGSCFFLCPVGRRIRASVVRALEDLIKVGVDDTITCGGLGANLTRFSGPSVLGKGVGADESSISAYNRSKWLGEIGIEGDDLSSLKSSHGLGSTRVMGVMSDLEDDPLVLIVGAPDSAFVMESRSPRLCRRVYAPIVGGESSWTEPLSTRVERACSRTCLVVKGQTGALFLLSVIVLAALMGDSLNMKWLFVLEEVEEVNASCSTWRRSYPVLCMTREDLVPMAEKE